MSINIRTRSRFEITPKITRSYTTIQYIIAKSKGIVRLGSQENLWLTLYYRHFPPIWPQLFDDRNSRKEETMGF